MNPVQPVVQERSAITDIEVLLQSMLPVALVAEGDVWSPTDRRFSCGESDHATSLCPVLNESFPFLPLGWRADRVDDEFVFAAAPEGGQLTSSGKRRLIRGGGLVSRISDDYEPQFPVVSEDLPCPAARDVVGSCVGAIRPLESVTRWSRVIRNSVRLPYSDSEDSDPGGGTSTIYWWGGPLVL